MKKLVLTCMLGLMMFGLNAQDSTKTKQGTTVIKMGNITVVKAPEDSTNKSAKSQDTLRVNDQIFIIGNGVAKSFDKFIEQ